MLKTALIASGSKGNSIFVTTSSVNILIDAGVSMKRIFDSLDFLGYPPSLLNGIFVSHEHSDHIRSIGAICRKLRVPLYITRKTYQYSLKTIKEVPIEPIFFEPGDLVTVGDMEIKTFSSSHDAVDGSNFVITQTNNDNAKLGLITDLGYPPAMTLQMLKNCTTVILESNHDIKMLMEGPYPWELKQRIKSRLGHLSNEQAVGVVNAILHSGLKQVILAHLSETNNLPDIAYKTMSDYVNSIGVDMKIFVAEQDIATPILHV